MSIITDFSTHLWPKMIGLIDNAIDDGHLHPLAGEMVLYQLNSGGKRIRPLLAIAVGRALGGNEGDIICFATAVELLHNASLVHDDIQDNDRYRRGHVAAWKKYSKNQAINLGDILFSLAFDVFSRCGADSDKKLRVMEFSMKVVKRLVDGQIQDLCYRGRHDITTEMYFKLVREKTGSLFTLAAKGAGMLSDSASESSLAELEMLGYHIGNIFQIRDDVIDILGEKEGRPAGSDIVEGKITVLSSYCNENLSMREKKKLMAISSRKGVKGNKNFINKVVDIYDRCGAFKHAYKLYRKENEKIFSIPIVKENKVLHEFISELLSIISMPEY